MISFLTKIKNMFVCSTNKEKKIQRELKKEVNIVRNIMNKI
jgi:hypothetical protein